MAATLVEDAVWSRLAEKCGAPDLELDAHNDLHKICDASELTLSRLFSVLDVKETGTIGKSELKVSMERIIRGFGGNSIDSQAFRTIWEAVHEDQRLSLSAFQSVIRRLKLELLLRLGDNIPAPPPGNGPHITLKNSKLFNEDVVLKCFSFTRSETFAHTITQGKLKEFYLDDKARPNVVLNWIVVDCQDTIDVLRLGTKFGLHPLHVDDCLKLERQKAKSVTHNEEAFITIPILRLTQQSRRSLTLFQERTQEEEYAGVEAPAGGKAPRRGVDAKGQRIDEPFPILMEQATIGHFITANNTVITVRSTWKALRGKGSSSLVSSAGNRRPRSRSEMLRAMRRKKSINEGPGSGGVRERRGISSMRLTGSGHTEPDSLDNSTHAKKRTSREVEKRAERQLDHALEDFFDVDEEGIGRETKDEDEEDEQMLMLVSEMVHHANIAITGNTPHWLLHGVIDHLVDRLMPIVDAYQTSLHWYQEVLHEDESKFGKVRSKKLMKIKSDLMWLQRKVSLLRPVLKHLLRKVEGDLHLYYQDIDDHLERCSESLAALVTLCQNCVDYVRSHREAKANQVLLVITVITTVFAPAGFLAGVYGMNFADPISGFATIPELTWKYGYVYFWVWTVVLMLGIMGFLRYKLHYSVLRALK